MFLNRLLNKIPYFRNKRIARMKKDLVEIRNNFSGGFFNAEFISRIHNIVNSPLIAFSEEIIYGTMKEIDLHTNSSIMALKLLNKKVYSKSDLERSSLLTMTQHRGYFNEWYSNEESVIGFIEGLKPYIAAQVWLNENPEIEILEEVDLSEFGDVDTEMYDTLLYRLLLSDLANIISFYLEIQHE